jgi:hypothetical protein
MRASASVMGVVLMLGLLGCQGSDDAPSVEPAPTTSITTGLPQKVLTPEERVSQWISACEVREILFTHENIAYITLREGEERRVRLDDAAADRIAATAFQQRCPDRNGKHIIVAIE